MPPKVENIASLVAKRDIVIASLDELYEEFNILYQVEPELIALENVHKEIATKYRSVKKQQSTIAERLIESGETESDEMSANKQIGDKVKSDYLKYTERFVVYQKKLNAEKKTVKRSRKARSYDICGHKNGRCFKFAKERKPWIREIVCSHVGWS